MRPAEAAARRATLPTSPALDAAVTLVVYALVAVCCILPVAWMFWQILRNPAALAEAGMGRFRLELMARTLLYNGSVAVIATVIAVPAAVVLGRGRGWLARVMWFVLPTALLLPSLAYAYGWKQVLRIAHIDFSPAGPGDVARCVWSLAGWLWALPAGAMGLALRQTDTQIQQHAMLDGALWRVTARQLLGPAAAGLAIVWVLSMQEFAVYEPTGISVVSTEVRMVFDTGAISSADNPITAPVSGGGAMAARMDQRARAAAAVVTAAPLLAVIGLLAILAAWGVRQASAAEALEIGPWPKVLDAGWIAKSLAVFVVLLTVGVPTAALAVSLQRRDSIQDIWETFGPQVSGTLSVAAVAGLTAATIALGASARRARGLLAAGLVSFLVGGQLLAIAMIRLYNHRWSAWVYNAAPIVVMAYLARFGWLPLVAARSTWARSWRELREMAAVDGADGAKAAWLVVWPLAWPLIVASGVLVMILSLAEVPATVLLSPQRPPLMTPMLMQWVHMLRYDAMIEGSLMMMGIVVVLALGAVGLVGLAFRLHGSGFRKLGFTLILATLLSGCGRGNQPDEIWCDTGIGPGQVVYPRGICYSPGDDSFFIVDRHAHVQHLSRKGDCLNDWRTPEWAMGKPTGISVGPDGNVYIPDTHYQRVLVYSPDGKELRRWGSAGTGPGQFIYPTDVAFDDKGHVFVSEYGDNDRIQVFDTAGKYLYQIGRFGQGEGEFSRPQSMVIVGDLIYVTDQCNHRIDVFKTDGKWVRNMGSCGSALGQFRFPYGMDMDSSGRLVVCEFGNNRVQLIDKETGRGLAVWGRGGHEPGELAYPCGVAVDKRDRVIAVDAGNNRLQVFEF